MKKIIIKSNTIPDIEPNVSCIGYFDGIHIGHQKLIEETIRLAKKNKVKSCLICFDPDPIDVINNKKNKHLLSYSNRIKAIESFGIEQIIVIKFDVHLMKMKPDTFVRKYLNKFNIKTLICGFDFAFGYNASGSGDTLVKVGKFDTIIIPEVKYKKEKVSSSRIKNELIQGNFKHVCKLLGWNYYLELKVDKYYQNGSKWLIKAKLKDSQCILPRDGVYGEDLVIYNGIFYLSHKTKVNKNQLIILGINDYE